MPKKIGFFSISTELGGAEKSLRDLLTAKKPPFHAWLITTKNRGPLIDSLHSENIPLISLDLPRWILSLSRKKKLQSVLLLPMAGMYSSFLVFRLAKLIKSQGFDVVHSTGLKFHLWLIMTSLLCPKAHFVIHLRDIFNNRLLQCIFQWASKRKNIEFIANSKATAHPLPSINTHIIYNGFDQTEFSPGSTRLRKTLDIPEESLVIGIVAVLAQWKGQELFIAMANELLKNHPQLHFLIVGSEIYDTHGEKGELDKLKKLAQQVPSPEQIHFLPFQKNITEIYRSLDIFVHCSLKPEPFGRVIVEALLCGCPVVASDQGGPTEVIESGRNGLLYPMGDQVALLKCVNRLIQSEALRRQLGQQGRVSALHFSLENYRNQLNQRLLNH
ncbi:MAG: glycosyltransferase family 4 protein [Bdellovibrionales bacterium]|nr:glycosyltransferase family 4 protein [Bdellovibrionales bacterium]